MSGARAVLLFALGRRARQALLVVAGSAVGLRIALLGQWDAYGALQLPLIFEAAAAIAVVATAASPFGEPERVAGRRLPYLRAALTAAMTAVAVGLLCGAGLGGHLVGGSLEVLRNVVGLTGIGLLCAAALGGGLSWTGPTGYLVAAIYALYTQWHPPALTTPWLWPARPTRDLGGALCAGLVFACGFAAVTLRGARDRPSDPDAA